MRTQNDAQLPRTELVRSATLHEEMAMQANPVSVYEASVAKHGESRDENVVA